MNNKAVLLGVIIVTCILLSGCGGNTSATPDSATKKTEETTTLASTTEPPTTVPLTTVPPTTMPPTTMPPTTVHTHQWEDVTSTIHHDAVYGQVWVVDKPAETKNYKVISYECDVCLRTFDIDFDFMTSSERQQTMSLLEQHKQYELSEYYRKMELFRNGKWSPMPDYPTISTHDFYFTKDVPEEGHYENQVTKEAYDETVITGQRCKTCGEYRAVETKNN